MNSLAKRIMKVLKLGFLMAAACCFFASRAEAQSLRVRQWQQNLEKRVSESAADAAEKCKTALTASYDWTAAAPEQIEKEENEGFYCGTAVIGAARICRDKLGQKAFASKIKKIQCKFGEPEVKLEGDTLSIAVKHKIDREDEAFKDVYYDSITEQYLLDNL